MGILGNVEGLLKGKKTFIVAILVAIGAGLKAYGIEIPQYVWLLLGSLGLGAVRAGINK